ncbi:MAG: hypothetical protein LUE29_10815 [Lachnospiraceae bacterium]|nr:hypothetical protein [Lachnospiraceae bacterium]
MPVLEKEYNGYLFDQLTLIEDIRRVTNCGNIEEIKTELDWKQRQIERKLFQKSLLMDGHVEI